MERLEGFQEYIKELEAKEKEVREREKEERKRQERRNRDAFREMLLQHKYVDCMSTGLSAMRFLILTTHHLRLQQHCSWQPSRHGCFSTRSTSNSVTTGGTPVSMCSVVVLPWQQCAGVVACHNNMCPLHRNYGAMPERTLHAVVD